MGHRTPVIGWKVISRFFISCRHCEALISGTWRHDKPEWYLVRRYLEGQQETRKGLRFFVLNFRYYHSLTTPQGRMNYPTGSTFFGEWVDDEICGEGHFLFVLTSPDSIGTLKLESGLIYEGGWKSGKFHGSGKHFHLHLCHLTFPLSWIQANLYFRMAKFTRGDLKMESESDKAR